jgi:Tol biopolymer transport system component
VANASGWGDPSRIREFSNETPPAPAPINLTWSPDGEKIAFYEEGIDERIEVIKDDDNGQWDRIGPKFNDLDDAQPPYSWSPDGKRIAFVDKFDLDLYVINADGSERRRLTHTLRPEGYPTWSPDGKKIAFFCPAPPGSKGRDLCTINADGSEWKRIALKVLPDKDPLAVSWGSE